MVILFVDGVVSVSKTLRFEYLNDVQDVLGVNLIRRDFENFLFLVSTRTKYSQWTLQHVLYDT